MKKILKVVAVATMIVLGCLQTQANERIRAQVSAPGATMFVINTHLASVLKERHGYNLEVATGFPGVRSQINNAKGEADLSLYAPQLTSFLINKVGPYKKLKNNMELASKLRVLFTFSGDLLSFATYDSSIKTLADIEGKRVFLGPKGAVLVKIQSDMIQDATGLVAGEDYELVNIDWAGSSALLQDGSVDVLFQLCSVGCSTWTELSVARALYFVGFTDAMLAKKEFQKHLAPSSGRFIYEVAPNTWKGQANKKSVKFLGATTGLLANEFMSDEIAYNITKAFWESKDGLAKIFPPAKDYTIKKAGFGVVIEMHPGSRKYLKEQGVQVK